MNLIHQLFSFERLSRVAELTALKWESGSWSYRELHHWIQKLSSELSNRGVGVGDRVVFQCSDTARFVASYLAVINIGAVSVAVSTRVSDEDLKDVIDDARPRLLVRDSTKDKLQFDLNAKTDTLCEQIQLDDFGMETSRYSQTGTIERGPNDECLWVYSSGSTSRPKGIVHTHQMIIDCSVFHLETLEIEPGDVVFCTSRLSFAYALANGLLIPLLIGATVYLHPDWVSPSDVCKVLRKESVKVLFSVPSIYRALLNHVDSDGIKDFGGPEYFVSAGEHLPSQIQQAWKEVTGKTIINAYGCSETLFLAFAGNADDTPAESVGKALECVEPWLIDFNTGNQLEQLEQAAVLYLSHPFMFNHYANRMRETEARLVDNRFVTGDLFRCDSDGNWYHLGREDDRIKVSGQWVELREVEHIGRSCDAANEVAVVSATDHQGMRRSALFFVPDEDLKDTLAINMMREHVNSQLPGYKRPSWIRTIAEIPRTVNGKIGRGQLQKLVEGQERDAI